MNPVKVILLVLTSSLLGACNPKPDAEKITAAKVIGDSIKPGQKDTSAQTGDGCTGAVPDHSIVDSLKYPNRRFHLAKRQGCDEFETAEGDSIIIEHANCDYSTYHFNLTTDRFDHDPSDTGYWINIAADIISEIKPALRLTINMDSGLYYLRKYYADKERPINTEIHFDDRPEDQWMNVVTVENFTKQGRASSLTVTFYSRPL
jgi:hypothetical protein